VKDVKIDGELFFDLYLYHNGLIPEDELTGAKKRIVERLQSKFDAMLRHDTFTKYKSAAVGSAEREQRRNEYLDLCGYLPAWRSQEETTDL